MAGSGKADPTKKVVIRCDREEGCPLYQRGDRVEFSNVTVSGLQSAPVCFRAVDTFIPIVDKIRAGSPPWNYENSCCGGCEHGKAWFAFSAGGPDNAYHLTTKFEEFAII